MQVLILSFAADRARRDAGQASTRGAQGGARARGSRTIRFRNTLQRLQDFDLKAKARIKPLILDCLTCAMLTVLHVTVLHVPCSDCLTCAIFARLTGVFAD